MAAVHGMQTGRLPWGAEHHCAFCKPFCHRTGMLAICEDLPEQHNTVTLDPVLKDANGIPPPKITYRLSENDRRMGEPDADDPGAGTLRRRQHQAAAGHPIRLR
jgi:choline dehydrogenase-like flavoprotein